MVDISTSQSISDHLWPVTAERAILLLINLTFLSILWKESSVGVVDASRIYLRTNMARGGSRGTKITWTEGLDFPKTESPKWPVLSFSLFAGSA